MGDRGLSCDLHPSHTKEAGNSGVCRDVRPTNWPSQVTCGKPRLPCTSALGQKLTYRRRFSGLYYVNGLNVIKQSGSAERNQPAYRRASMDLKTVLLKLSCTYKSPVHVVKLQAVT